MTTDQNFVLAAGDRHTLVISVVDEIGAAVNLDEATEIKWILADTMLSAARVTKKLTTTGITKRNQTSEPGVFEVAISAADTSGITAKAPASKLFHEAMVTMSSGETATVLRGTLTLLPSPVKAA